jgi:exonuclease III
VSSFDFVCLQETFTYNNFDFSIHFENFISVSCPAVKLSRMGRGSGGIVLLVKECWSDFVRFVETGSQSILCVRISKALFGSNKDVLFVGTYIHPINSPFYNDKDFECTLEDLERFLLSVLVEDDVDFIVGGDLNSRIGNWGLEIEDEENFDSFMNAVNYTYARESEDSCINSFGKKLIELCTVFDLLPVNGLVSKKFDNRYTFFSEVGQSVIDYFLCSADVLPFVKSLNVLSRIESPHMPVILSCDCVIQNSGNEESEKASLAKVRWDPAKKQDFCNFMTSDYAGESLASASALLDWDVDAALNSFTNLLHEASECMKKEVQIGGKKQKGRNKWYDRECEKLKREARRSLAHFRHSHLIEDRDDYKEKRNVYIKTIEEKKKSYWNLVKESLDENKQDSKKFWSTVRSLRCKPRELPQIDIFIWKEYFEGIFNDVHANDNDGNVKNMDNVEYDVFVSELDEPISEAEVLNAVRSLSRIRCLSILNQAIQ